MSEAMRLDKHLVALIQCSRGEAQKYIEGGWVLVDGVVVDQPQFKVLEQKVELHADATLTAVLPRTMLLNLPEGFDVSTPTAPLQLITPQTHTENDRSGIRVLKRHFARLVPTAPIEPGASGLMVFSQDGKIVRKLVEDAKTNEQEYSVDVSGEIEPDGLQKLNNKMKQNGWLLPAAKVSWQSETRLRFALKNVHSGQIKFMCASVGLSVVAMTRLRIGRVSMGKLPPGEWRYLPEDLWF
ncbi:MAG: rRNA pseudouridine synthase [Methyloprofundus sp.]|nr:rRNA pseudouridine synthase [Methyloprofundus sp.]MDT8425029.1 rRNA pseudouridine synthase [Methyloprofundus sp.]